MALLWRRIFRRGVLRFAGRCGHRARRRCRRQAGKRTAPATTGDAPQLRRPASSVEACLAIRKRQAHWRTGSKDDGRDGTCTPWQLMREERQRIPQARKGTAYRPAQPRFACTFVSRQNLDKRIHSQSVCSMASLVKQSILVAPHTQLDTPLAPLTFDLTGTRGDVSLPHQCAATTILTLVSSSATWT